MCVGTRGIELIINFTDKSAPKLVQYINISIKLPSTQNTKSAH